jgi:hypothetical protein
MASQIQLTNTFNEFRQAYNDAANDVTTLQSSNTTIFAAVAGANTDIDSIIGLPIPATQTFVVTSVANPGTPPPNNIYQIDAVNNPVLNLVRGGVYTFDLSDATNAGHPLAFRTSANASFTTGVVSTGTAGQAGAQVVFTVPDDAPADLKYYCTVHGNGMGNTIAVTGAGRGGILFATNTSITTLQSGNTTIFAAVNGANASIGTLGSELKSGTGAAYSNTLQVATLSAGGSRVLVTKIPVSGSGAEVIDDAGFIYHTANDSMELAGDISVGGDATVTGNVSTTGTTTSTGTLTVGSDAAIIVAANGTFISPSGNVTLNTTDSRIDAFDVHAENRVDAGVDLEGWATAVDEDLSIHRVISVESVDGASDHAVINRDDGIDAYAEFIAMNDVGNSSQGWISMGINSSNYGEAQYAVTKNDDGYILYQPSEGTSANGDLVIGTGGNGTKNRILFSANGFDVPEENTQMTITPGESVFIQINTESANTTTGALVVQGGIGLQGNLNVGGNVSITGTITLGGGGNTVSTSSLTVDSPIIFLGQNNAADTFDLGFVGEYTDGVEKYSGFVRDASDGGTYKLFANTSILPANTVDFTDVNLVYANILVAGAQLVSDTDSSSNTTGALTVSGGVGIAKSVTIGQNLVVEGSATFTGGVRVQELIEDVVDVAASTNTYNVDYNNGNIFYATSAPASNDFTLAATNVPTADGRITTLSLILPQGATARRPASNSISINGTSTLINFVGGNTSYTPTASKTDIFNFTILRRGGTFTVAGTVSANTAL